MSRDTIQQLENVMWDSAKNRNRKSFEELVDANAIMVCGGYRCSGMEYAHVIEEFDIAKYTIKGYETIYATENIVQNHYLVDISVNDSKNSDLAGTFHITSTWQKKEKWKLIFNMDSKITN